MPINLFDCFLVAFLVAGVIRGRRHGVSAELLRVLKWLSLVLGCALAYRPLGIVIESFGLFDACSSLVLGYLGAALLILLLFSRIERSLAPKLAGTDAFGRAEYYLGMGSGLVRYSCILIMGLALLNARAFTPAEVRARERYQEDTYGSAVFPTLNTFQELVFVDSLTGACIKNYLGFLLINSAPEDQSQPVPASAAAPARRS